MSLAVRITRPCRARGGILERGAVVLEGGDLGLDREDLANIVHADRGVWAKAPTDAPTLKDDPEPAVEKEEEQEAPPAPEKPKRRRGRPRKTTESEDS